jgi:hypothetical protein
LRVLGVRGVKGCIEEEVRKLLYEVEVWGEGEWGVIRKQGRWGGW